MFKPDFGDYGRQKKGKWVPGGDWLIDAMQDAVNEGGLDMADFETEYESAKWEAMEARAEARRDDAMTAEVDALPMATEIQHADE